MFLMLWLIIVYIVTCHLLTFLLSSGPRNSQTFRLSKSTMERGGRRKRRYHRSCSEGKTVLQRLTDNLHQTQNTCLRLPWPIWMAAEHLAISVPSPSQSQTPSKSITKVQEDPRLGRFLLQCKNSEVQPPGDRKNRGPHQRHVQRLLPPQLVPSGEHISQHRATIRNCRMGGFPVRVFGCLCQKLSPGSRFDIPVQSSTVHQLHPSKPAEAATGYDDGCGAQLPDGIPENRSVQEDQAMHV